VNGVGHNTHCIWLWSRIVNLFRGTGNRKRPESEDVPVYPHNISYTVHIDSPASEEDIAALYEAVERACPILNLLINPQQINGTIIHNA
jgi:uncharacterized OsmC-like protein